MLLSALLLALPIPAVAAPGDLDPSFDGDGSVLTDFGGFDAANALVVQSDGKLVAAGTTSIGNSGIALARHNPDGSPDASFGVAGKVVTLGANGPPPVNALVVQPDGKLVVGSGRFPGPLGGKSDLILARFHPDGSFDTSFGTGGLVVVSAGGIANALVLQPDGKLVVKSSLSLSRFHGDGTLDTSFGGDGSVVGTALVLQSDGKLVAAGRVTVCSRFSCAPSDFALERFNPDGSPDASFGSGGLVVTDFGAASAAHSLVLQADGKLVAAGDLTTSAFNTDRVLARYNPDGTLDASFGTGGVVVTDGGSPSSVGWLGLAIQADGRLVAGTAGMGATLFARYNPDGSPDTSFGSGGAVQFFGFAPFTTIPLAFQSDGKLVVGGSSFFNGNSDFVLARVLTADEPPNEPPNDPPNLLPKCGGRRATILGTSGNDTLEGTSGPDVILGLGGNDTIRGLEGNDTICGGPGRDRLIGNEGNDRLFGQGGNDKLFGDQGKDRLSGGSGRDACRTGERARRCEGKPASSKPSSGERPNDPPIPPRPPCPPISNFPCS